MEKPIFKLKNFDGPFDLLLHLIKKNKMNISDIPIHEITEQYLEYINMMQELDLEITSEFIVIAATLIEIKSKSLLPNNNADKEIEEKDLTKELTEKLIEYKKFKKVSEFLKSRELTIGEVFTKKPEVIEDVKIDNNDDSYLKNVTMLQLYRIYNEIIRIYNEKQNTTIIEKKINKDVYKVKDKIIYLKNKLQDTKILNFSQVIYECECKLEIIVSFLALLELTKEACVK
ncbi:segregation/condensation protein A, partial [Clostridium tarantellae]|nr:segregation/condensation protein A [Clostridium tarantellae]